MMAPCKFFGTNANMNTIDLRKAFSEKPPELDFIWPGFLAGTVGALIAPGATGKSFLALEAAMAVACDIAGGDLAGLAPVHTGRVVYIAGEDPPPVLVARIHAIGTRLGQSAREGIAENMTIKSIMGEPLDITNKDDLKQLIELCADTRLIVLDTLSRIHRMDENSNSNMAHVITRLEQVANTVGAAVLYLHHTNKTSAVNGLVNQQAARGASALIDNARWCGYVAKMTAEEAKHLIYVKYDQEPIGDRRHYFVKFGTSKINYGIPMPDCWLYRHDGGVLELVTLEEVCESSNKGINREKA